MFYLLKIVLEKLEYQIYSLWYFNKITHRSVATDKELDICLFTY
jgi:hypothetical protein